MHVVGAHGHCEDIVETEGGVHVVGAAGRLTQAMGRAPGKEAADALPRAVQRPVGNAKLLGVPEVYAGLITNLHIGV